MSRGPSSTSVGCVGRHRELERLTGVVAARATAVVSGPAGIGKSRLLDELSTQVEGPVVWGRCREAGPNAAYLPWLQIGAQLSKIVDPAEPALRLGDYLTPTFPHLLAGLSHTDDQPPPELVAIAWNEYLEEVVARCPAVVLAIEDIHRGDVETLTLLASLSGAGSRAPIVATMRHERRAEPDAAAALAEIDRNSERIELVGLSDGDAAELLDSLVDASEADRATAVALAAGNPLHLRDLASALARSGRLDTHTDLVSTRIASLDPQARSALQAASVLGGVLHVPIVAGMLDVEATEAADAIEQLVAVGFVERVAVDRTYRFVHDAYRSMTYDLLGASLRATWHARAFRVLSVDEAATADQMVTLATHAAMARPEIGSGPAVSWNLEAGERALASSAPATANTCFERALDLMTSDVDPSERDRTLLGIGRARSLLGRSDAHDPLDEVVHAARERGDHAAAVQAGLAGMPAVGPLGLESEPDIRLIRRLLTCRSLSEPGSRDRARLAIGLAMLDFTPDGIDRFDDHLAEIARAADDLDDSNLRAWEIVARHTAQRVPGVDDDTLAEIDAAMEGAEPKFGELHLSLWAVRLIMLLRLGRFASASSELTRLQVVVDRVPGVVAWAIHRWLTTLDLVSGNYDLATSNATRALELGAACGRERRATEYFELQLAAIVRDRGDDATDVARQWLARQPANPFVRSMAGWAIADCGDDERGLALLRGLPPEMLDDGRMMQSNVALSCAMYVAGWTGEQDLARRCLDAALPYRDEWTVLGNGLMVIGPTAVPLGVAASGLGQDDLAMDLLHEGRRRAVDGASPAAAAHAALEIARHRRRLGEADAAAWFGTAADEYAALDLPRRADRCRAAAADSTLSGRFGAVDAPPVRVARPAGRSELTTARLERRGRIWEVAYRSSVGTVPHRQGFVAIAALVERPDEAVTAVALAALLDGNIHDAVTAEEALLGHEARGANVLDERAVESIRRRARELQEEIDEAENDHDLARADKARVELEALVDELERNVGLGGRPRRFADHSERARTRITKSIRSAIAALHDELPELARHLDVSIRTGTHCEYRPDRSQRIAWTVSVAEQR